MRILFLNYEYPPLGGGAGNASYYILQEFSKKENLIVDFVTSSIDNQYHFKKIGENINLHFLPIGKNQHNLHFQSQKDLIIYGWKAFWFSRRLVKRRHYDLTHAFFTVPCGALAWHLKHFYKIPYLVSLRGSDVPGYSERFTMLYKFIGVFIKKIWKDAAAVVANSQGLKNLALKTYAQKDIAVIANGVDTEKFHPPNEKVNGPTTKDKPFRIICVSRITPRKGVRYLIEAVKRLKDKKEKNLRLTLVGDGNEKAAMQKMARKYRLEKEVIFLGKIDHDELYQHYSKADVYVSASLNEGMSNTMLEALAMGLPIIATNTGGTAEIVKEEENGFVVAMKDANDLAEKISRLKNNPALRARMANNSRRRAEKMKWQNVAEKYLSQYQEILNQEKWNED